MIAYLRACAEETDFLLRLPEEWDISVETEEALLRTWRTRRKIGCWCAR